MNCTQRSMAQGVTLIELMVALLIGTVLVLGLVEVFAASRTAYQLSEGLARVQENSRFAMDYLQRDLRMAGHYGCVNDQAHLQTTGALQSHFADSDTPVRFNFSIQGYEANGTAPGSEIDLSAPAAGWIPALPAYLAGLPSPGSDVIVLRYLAGAGVPVSSVVTTAGLTTVTVPPAKWSNFTSDGVTNPALFGLADCNYADIFQATTVSAGTGTITIKPTGLNTSDFTSDRYSASPAGQTMLYRAEAIAYYVADSTTAGKKSLWRIRFNSAPGAGALSPAAPEELVEGIENMQFLYGQDKSGDPTKLTGYMGSQTGANTLGTVLANWETVGLINVGLLSTSTNRAAALGATGAEEPSALSIKFKPPVPNDGFLRTPYESTIALRNRLYGQ